MVCLSPTPLFQREIIAAEELRDQRGEKYEHLLGRASWTQKPGAAVGQFTLTFDSTPQTDTILLTTQNGDNPPIELESFQFYYPITRIFFKAKTNDVLSLYYGNLAAATPHYDLSLVANELLAADKSRAVPGAEQMLKKIAWQSKGATGKGGVVFWGILALVVVALLVVIARLLPKSDSQPPK